MSDAAIRATALSKRFAVNRHRRSALKELATRGRAPKGDEFWALQDATFEIRRGETFGIIGHNGSGKSTALKVVAGIYRPTSGSVEVDGRLSALLELGAGFHPELTGRENVFLNGAILGLSRAEIRDAFDAIVDFSGIGEFIDAPVKVYSSGMYVRLGFAIAINVRPDILVIDEVIAVGDEDFQRRCFDHMHSLREQGATIVIVSHSMSLVEEICDSALWLDHGRVQATGPARDVVRSYLAEVNLHDPSRRETLGGAAGPITRIGDGDVMIERVECLVGDLPPSRFLEHGRPGRVRMHYRAVRDVPAATFGIGFFTETGVNVAGPNSGRDGAIDVPAGSGHVDFDMPQVLLAPGTYAVSTSVVDGMQTHDFVERGFEIAVRGTGNGEPGLVTHPGAFRAHADV